MIYAKFDTREGMEDALLDIGAARVRRMSAAGDAALVRTGTVQYSFIQSETDGKWLCMLWGPLDESHMSRLEDSLSDPF